MSRIFDQISDLHQAIMRDEGREREKVIADSREIISSRSAEHLQNIFLPINRQMRQESN